MDEIDKIPEDGKSNGYSRNPIHKGQKVQSGIVRNKQMLNSKN